MGRQRTKNRRAPEFRARRPAAPPFCTHTHQSATLDDGAPSEPAAAAEATCWVAFFSLFGFAFCCLHSTTPFFDALSTLVFFPFVLRFPSPCEPSRARGWRPRLAHGRTCAQARPGWRG